MTTIESEHKKVKTILNCIFADSKPLHETVKVMGKSKTFPKSMKLSAETINWMQANGYNPEDLNQRGENGDSALMKATREGNTAIVKELIDAGADVNIKNNDGNNALWFACFKDRYDLIDLLVASKVDIDNQNDNGATVLMYSASAGKTEVLKSLLQHGANLNLKNLDDFSALDFATTEEGLRILKNAKKSANS